MLRASKEPANFHEGQVQTWQQISGEFQPRLPPVGDHGYGLLENISISINTNKKLSSNEINIVPSLPKIDTKLQQQIDNSWSYATNFLKTKYIVFQLILFQIRQVFKY